MAYDKKYMGDEEVVKEYLDGREDRIEREFDGLIPERGSNSNGEYLKFPNGLLICWHFERRRNVAMEVPMNSLYREDEGYVWIFPHKFKERPSLSIEALSGLGNGKYISGNNPESATYRSTATVAVTRDAEFSYLAIGFWR